VRCGGRCLAVEARRDDAVEVDERAAVSGVGKRECVLGTVEPTGVVLFARAAISFVGVDINNLGWKRTRSVSGRKTCAAAVKEVGAAPSMLTENGP
jgi:hypothetical protein